MAKKLQAEFQNSGPALTDDILTCFDYGFKGKISVSLGHIGLPLIELQRRCFTIALTKVEFFFKVEV